ncbi:MAG: hypothetical protein CVU56_28515 [Deltaproteobacteria bacterium HGW-Deltaproteobacteria-14]|jgi:hypothetical protein|nr:MAG: hypothetical protein CVU56_28515 [Deltaproteobacteria bacterium HGW-Deltaproteobacteria-14]
MPFQKLISRAKNAIEGDASAANEKAHSEVKKKAAGAGDYAAQEAALKPKDGAKEAAPSGGLPESSQELLESAAFKITGAVTYTGAAAIPKEIAMLLMQGIAAEGVSGAKTVAEALASYVDEGRIEVRGVSPASGGASLTWIRFHAGDTEVGYMFDKATLKAIVSDGWIERA